MSTCFATITRPMLLCALILGLGVSTVHAACSTYACYTPAAPAVTPAIVCETAVCSVPVCTTSCPSQTAATTLPGYYSDDYNYTVSSQRNTSGINYLIPTTGGLLESPTIPLTNPVDEYYATHRVVNGQVVRTAQTPPNLAVAATFDERNRDTSRLNTQTPGQNTRYNQQDSQTVPAAFDGLNRDNFRTSSQNSSQSNQYNQNTRSQGNLSAPAYYTPNF